MTVGLRQKDVERLTLYKKELKLNDPRVWTGPLEVKKWSLTVTRMTEESGVVVAEGSLRCAKRDGALLKAAFCDGFVILDAKTGHLTSYLVAVKR